MRLLIKGVSKTIENETKEQKGGYLGMLLGTLAASLFEKMLISKAKMSGRGVLRSHGRTIGAGQDF